MSEWVIMGNNFAERKLLQGKIGGFIVRLINIKDKLSTKKEKTPFLKLIYKTKEKEREIYAIRIDYRLRFIRSVCEGCEIKDGVLYNTISNRNFCTSLFMRWCVRDDYLGGKCLNWTVSMTNAMLLSPKVYELAYMLMEESLMELFYEYFLDCCRRKFGDDMKFYSHHIGILCKRNVPLIEDKYATQR